MKYGQILEALKEKGLEAKFSHFRMSEDGAETLIKSGGRLTERSDLVEAKFALRENNVPIDVRGGYTHCAILKGETVVAEGEAWCNPILDQFNKRIGREVALGRAMKALKDSGNS